MSRFGFVACIAATFFLLLGATLVFAQEGESAGSGATVSKDTCLSGMKWTEGNAGSPLMHPGGNCIACHQAGEGPAFLSSGTVYQQLKESDDCYGVEGATVQLTDAKGQVIKLTTNKAGNFSLRARGATLAMPFKAKVILKGKERAMMTGQSAGNCASCHTAKGANGAPGRIIIPAG